jgi:2,3-bisphosphoglycerate-independent phosphoglycerate mutase
MAKKYLILLGDGMADYPVERLGGKTPLQAANKPNMDRIAREGCCGLFQTLEPEMPTGSAVANLSVMGYNTAECFEGRGVLEAASMGVDISETDMAMRCNLICLEDGKIKNHSAGHITSEEAAEIIQFLHTELGNEKIRFYPGVSYRHLFVGEGLDPRLVCYPPHDHPNKEAAGLPIEAKVEQAKETARILNELTRKSQEILPNHPVNQQRVTIGKDPANSIWLWSPGRRPKMWTFPERFGVTGGVISAVDLIHGIGIYAGLEKITVEGATGLWDTNYEGKADAALKVLETHDFCYLHVEAPDEAGHEGDPHLKVKTIEDLDARLVSRVLEGLEKKGFEANIALLPDHPTPVEHRIHTREPVPFVIWKPGNCADGVQQYDELSCAEGSFGTVRRDEFIRSLFDK